MTQAIDSLQVAKNRIYETVTTLQQQNSAFQDLNRDRVTEDSLTLFLEKYQPEEILAFSEERLSRSIKDLMSWGMIYGLVANFTPEQMKAFDDAVEN